MAGNSKVNTLVFAPWVSILVHLAAYCLTKPVLGRTVGYMIAVSLCAWSYFALFFDAPTFFKIVTDPQSKAQI